VVLSHISVTGDAKPLGPARKQHRKDCYPVLCRPSLSGWDENWDENPGGAKKQKAPIWRRLEHRPREPGVVREEQRKDHLGVRARRRGDIERVSPEMKVRETPEGDYRFRALAPRARVAPVLAARAMAISYTNFKNSVADDDRHQAYSAVALQRLAPNPTSRRDHSDLLQFHSSIKMK
jgi:hypothetical protein